MTNQEFSNSFTTLLNSYNTQAQFGEESSKADISLDEYEKSVLLTQAQDLIVKSYFNRNFNQQGEGFDDSTRRQVDFSSLIRVAKLEPTDSNMLYDSRGVVFKMPRKVTHGHIVEGTTDVLFILNEKLIVEKTLINGKRKTWILNNYNGGSAIYYTEPIVKYYDQSTYYLIDGYDTRLFNHPGNPTFHGGHNGYWMIENDPIIKKYSSQPKCSVIGGHPKRWFVNDSTWPYYTEPHIEHYTESKTFYTIDLDENGTTYEERPEDPTHYDEVLHHWYINNDTENKYYEEIEFESNTSNDGYFYIDLDEPRIQYPTNPVLNDFTHVWEIYDNDYNGQNYNPLTISNSDPGTPVHVDPVPGLWRVTDGVTVANIDFDPEGKIVHNVIKHWEVKINGETRIFDHNPVSSIRDTAYWIDTETRNQSNPNFKEYYLRQEPDYKYVGNQNQDPISPTNPVNPTDPDDEFNHAFENVPADGWYIIKSNYGDDIGPFVYEPNIQPVLKYIQYWLIDDDIKNPYFTEIKVKEVTDHENWQLYDEKTDITYTFDKKPNITVIKNPEPEKWTLIVNGVVTPYYLEPTVTEIWQATINGVVKKYTQEPHVVEVQAGGTYYTVVYTNDGDGHQAGDVVNDAIYDEEPTITEIQASNERWVFFEGTENEIEFNSEPQIIEHTQSEYWTVDVIPDFIFTENPVITEEDEVSTKFKIDIDGREFDFEPNIKYVNRVESYWTFNNIDKEFLTTDPPKVTQFEDSSEGARFYTINDTSDHYFGNGEPNFDITEGVDPKKSIDEYVIVPISYREYDREMSKPYAQPLKKQAWRLFQNNSTGFDFDSELIPKFNIRQQIFDAEKPGFSKDDVQLFYKIRYIRRPRPIILEDLPNGLEIDGENEESSCELNPIIHIDILTKAVELALATRSKAQPQQGEQRERER